MLIYGKNVAVEKLKTQDKINKIYLSDKFKDKEILDLIEKRNIKIKLLDNHELDKMCKGLHQGIILDVQDIKTYNLDEIIPNINKEYPLVVILDHLEDPHNFGAIIRTCEAAGVDYIIIPKNRSVSVNSTVMKTSVGALDNVKIVEVTNLNNTIKKLKDNGVWVVGTDLENSVSYDKIDYTTSIALIIGSEGFGMSNLVKKNCDFIANIPMYGKINSLNASVAAGIMIYEVVRQRK